MAINAGKRFCIQCGVRQGGVLSPYLFALYIDDVIKALRNSGYDIFVGNIFTGCILYADDTVLLSCSFCGLQKWSIFVLSMVLARISSLTI